MNDTAPEAHFRHSVLREIILEHALIADLLRHFWRRDIFDVEVLRSEFDAGGYDLVLSRGAITRHVQLKAKRLSGRTANFAIASRLAARPSGAVLCLVVDDDLEIDHFLLFAGPIGKPLPEIGHFPVARHTKGNATGQKFERPALRRVPIREFRRLETLSDVAESLLATE
ncbi:hypothetical protein HKCCE3408_15980 [Rhodobacterales bacterium HKCCE3408]|nr:hypothetical protein [Rhodobacterales bacterium HKCCE3408]